MTNYSNVSGGPLGPRNWTMMRKGRNVPFMGSTGGMIQNRDERFLTPNEAVEIINMHSTEEGTWTCDNIGYSVVNASGTAYESGATIDGLFWWTDASSVDHLLMAINGKMEEINVNTGVNTVQDSSAGFTAGNKVGFQALGGKVYMVDGSIATPRTWDGTTAGNSGGWPVTDGTNNYTKPKYIATHNGRMAYANFNNFPNTFALSDLNSPAAFTTNPATVASDGYIGNCPNDGQYIVGMHALHIPATNEDQLLIVRNNSTYVLTGSSGLLTDSNVFTLVKTNGNYGAFNQKCIVPVGNDILMLCPAGITSYSSSNYSGTLEPLAINSDAVRAVLQSINTGSIAQAWGIHIPLRREVWWFVPTGSNTHCDTAIVYKYPTPGDNKTTPKWSLRQTDSGNHFYTTAGVLLNSTFYVGMYNGILGKMFGSSLYGAVSIPWRYEFPTYDYGNEKQFKRMVDGTVHVRSPFAQTINIENIWSSGNNNDDTTETLTLNPTIDGTLWGAANWNAFYYSGPVIAKAQFLARGNGGRLKQILTGNTGSRGLDFLGIQNYLEFGGPNLTWN